MPTESKYKYQKKSLARRVAYLEKKQWQNRPEMKYLSGFHNTLTLAGQIATGPLADINYGDGNNNRVGNEILLHKIELRGHLGNPYCEALVVIGNGAAQAPLSLDFDMKKGGGIKPSARPAYKTIAHIWKTNAPDRFTRIIKFKKPLRVKYEGGQGTDAVDNVPWLVFKNCLSATDVTPEISILIHYTDP